MAEAALSFVCCSAAQQQDQHGGNRWDGKRVEKVSCFMHGVMGML